MCVSYENRAACVYIYVDIIYFKFLLFKETFNEYIGLLYMVYSFAILVLNNPNTLLTYFSYYSIIITKNNKLITKLVHAKGTIYLCFLKAIENHIKSNLKKQLTTHT